jgi:AAA+ superfamily predicted ATPase
MSTATKIATLIKTLSAEIASKVTAHHFRTFCDTIASGIDDLNRFQRLGTCSSIFKSHDSFVAFCTATAWWEVINQVKNAILADDDVDSSELALAYEILTPAADCIAEVDDSWAHFSPLLPDEIGSFIDFAHSETPRVIRAYVDSDGEFGLMSTPLMPVLITATLATGDMTTVGIYKKTIALAFKLIVQADGHLAESEQAAYEVAKKITESVENICKVSLEHLHETFNSNANSTKGASGELAGSGIENVTEGTLDPDTALTEATKELEGLIGLKPVKREISRLANYLKIEAKRQASGLAAGKQALHFIFTGNPGTGKTTVGRIMAKLLYGYGVLKTPVLVETDRGNLVGGYVGQTAIKTKEVLASALDGVLFVDEAYTLSGKGDNDFGREAIDTILKAMEDNRDRLVVIAAGYTHNMSEFLETNPGLKSRFTRFIDFPDYSPKDLCKIFVSMASQNQYTLAPEALANLGLLCHALFSQRDRNFGNGRVVRNLFEKTLGNHADRIVEVEELTREVLTTITADDLPYEMANLRGKIDLSNERWLAKCEGCGAVHKTGLKLIGNAVKCKCGHAFRAPFWTLVIEGKPFAKLVADDLDEEELLVWI